VTLRRMLLVEDETQPRLPTGAELHIVPTHREGS
jgi:hypothetical protein